MATITIIRAVTTVTTVITRVTTITDFSTNADSNISKNTGAITIIVAGSIIKTASV